MGDVRLSDSQTSDNQTSDGLYDRNPFRHKRQGSMELREI